MEGDIDIDGRGREGRISIAVDVLISA